ncbi:RNA-directed DNA polymerase from mobile element jockey [Aphis craccivora]|uniref:RNA-directed DNA polymerase from mobile element jockey n=1 Tax=Aphis craccivora TaxID=307492 RepID=A0A6G0VL87_APHCR|nr:RNA-directed DNA polymerase from mobile element jockey [Aphis craccivora]
MIPQFLSHATLIADTFNSYFISMGNHNNANSNKKQYHSVNNNSTQSLYLRMTTKKEINYTINNMKGDSAAGKDGITINIIKHIKESISDILEHIFNTILTFEDFKKLGVEIGRETKARCQEYFKAPCFIKKQSTFLKNAQHLTCASHLRVLYMRLAQDPIQKSSIKVIDFSFKFLGQLVATFILIIEDSKEKFIKR